MSRHPALRREPERKEKRLRLPRILPGKLRNHNGLFAERNTERHGAGTYPRYRLAAYPRRGHLRQHHPARRGSIFVLNREGIQRPVPVRRGKERPRRRLVRARRVGNDDYLCAVPEPGGRAEKQHRKAERAEHQVKEQDEDKREDQFFRPFCRAGRLFPPAPADCGGLFGALRATWYRLKPPVSVGCGFPLYPAFLIAVWRDNFFRYLI